MDRPASEAFDDARVDAGLSQEQLWMRYFGIGGMAPPLELEAIVNGAMLTNERDQDRIAHALNERFTELGRNHPVPYSNDGGTAPG